MASFLKGQSQIKGLSYVLFLALLFSLQFQAYILLDFRTSSVVRTVVLSELPFMGLLIFTNFYLMSQLNVKSKRILPQLDCCLHRPSVAKVAGGLQVDLDGDEGKPGRGRGGRQPGGHSPGDSVGGVSRRYAAAIGVSLKIVEVGGVNRRYAAITFFAY
ncbi:hypothetical protein TYRP_022541 [Tyrophagus putrescentiae]|nr:hypothetical protein TYRP_022541 [Tyrophagus putrescentiae]